MNFHLELNEFFVEGGNNEKSHVLLHITEPGSLDEYSKGYFFSLIETESGSADDISNVQEFINEIENNYYLHPDEKRETAFETVLEKSNNQAFAITGSGIVWNGMIGILYQNEILFSFFGTPQALVIYKTPEGGYKKMDLVALNTPSQSENKQLFSEMIQGKISIHDYFVVGSKHLSEYINHDRLQKIITTRSTTQSVEHIKNVLTDLKTELSFGGFIMRLSKEKNIQTTKFPRERSQNSEKSLNSLFTTEQNTAHTLSSSLWPELNKKIQSFIDKKIGKSDVSSPPPRPTPVKNFLPNRRPQSAQGTRDNPVTEQEPWMKWLLIILKYISKAIAWILSLLYLGFQRSILFFQHIFFIITNHQNQRRSIMQAWSKCWHERKANVKNLPKTTKIMLLISALLIGIFIGTLFYLRHQSKLAADKKIYTQNIEAIKKYQVNAESALIYRNESQASQELTDAQNLMKTTCPDTTSPKATEDCKKAANDLEQLSYKIRKFTLLPATTLAEWASTKLQNIVTINNTLYAYSDTTSSLYTYNLLSKEAGVLSPPSSLESIKFAALGTNSLLILTKDNKLVEYNPTDQSWKNQDMNFKDLGTIVDEFFVYNSRLYTIDATHNHIYRHNATNTGFGQGQDWITDSKINIIGTVSTAIDGNIFLLKKTGEVIKLTRGQGQNFTVPTVNPTLTSASKIWTSTDSGSLFILDSDQKRILTLDKSGNFKLQLTAKELISPTGLTVDESKKTIYITDQGKILQMNY